MAKIICLIFRHRWAFWGLCGSEPGSVTFEKCSRCGKYKGNGKARLEKYLND